jgi:hypothetical protein
VGQLSLASSGGKAFYPLPGVTKTGPSGVGSFMGFDDPLHIVPAGQNTDLGVKKLCGVNLIIYMKILKKTIKQYLICRIL